ncbi:hypothetical protein CAI21_18960 [Alkalilimnicola ehrlichii]|uniref:Histidine phosphatase family protein n=1 Tax=Alkalilimnicola ehrlichii TaxID=351052 RepID=A0A3E0WIM1_9GAMM|nr:histidine phosphatase family protein [Alkalilimnicola ehrlichii]RFA25518.1 hypothetical protein CAI21_18960 [Alkalilimnicola ehrlichii]RFA32628.1 hypothetical protein CAL65_19355 [Alkalilimnicola ehrlichii]
MRLIQIALVFLTLTLAVAPVSAEVRLDTSLLQQTGLVLYLRHAHTERDQNDRGISLLNIVDELPEPATMRECSRQRNLSERGRKQAEEIGQLLHALQFAVGTVYTSSFCRNRETAELAFPEHRAIERDSALFNQPAIGGHQLSERVTQELRTLLSTPPTRGNRLLIGHNVNLQYATDLRILEGEMALFKPNAGGYELLAVFGKADLRALSAPLMPESGGWQEPDAIEQVARIYEHMQAVEGEFAGAWQAAANNEARNRVRDQGRLALEQRIRDDSQVRLSLKDYYQFLANYAGDTEVHRQLAELTDTRPPTPLTIADDAKQLLFEKRWIHGNKTVHAEGRFPHPTIHEILVSSDDGDNELWGNVVEVTGLLDFSFIKRAQQRGYDHGFYLMSAHRAEHGLFGEVLCTRDDVQDLELDLPQPNLETASEEEIDRYILALIRASDNGFRDYTQRNILGATTLQGRLLNTVVLEHCRVFIK